MDIQLVKWETKYIDQVAIKANNKKIADNLRNGFPYPYTYGDAQGYVNFCIEGDETKQCCRAILVDGILAGSIGVFIKDDVYCLNGELGYWLGEDYWGKGIMTNSIMEISEYTFSTYNIIRIFAEPFSYNIGSRKALEKAGFELEGILKKSVYKGEKVYDSCIYAKLK